MFRLSLTLIISLLPIKTGGWSIPEKRSIIAPIVAIRRRYPVRLKLTLSPLTLTASF